MLSDSEIFSDSARGLSATHELFCLFRLRATISWNLRPMYNVLTSGDTQHYGSIFVPI